MNPKQFFISQIILLLTSPVAPLATAYLATVIAYISAGFQVMSTTLLFAVIIRNYRHGFPRRYKALDGFAGFVCSFTLVFHYVVLVKCMHRPALYIAIGFAPLIWSAIALIVWAFCYASLEIYYDDLELTSS